MIKRILAAIFICFLVYAQVTSIPSAAGGGSGASSVAELTDLQVNKTSSSTIVMTTGKIPCGPVIYTIAQTSFVLTSGSATSYIGIDCANAGDVVLARGANVMSSPTGYTSSSDVNLDNFPNIIPIASITVSGNAWNSVTNLRTLGSWAGGVVAGSDISVTQDANGLPVVATSKTIPTVLTGTATIDFADTANAACSADSTITVTGAAVTDTITIGIPAGAVGPGLFFFGYIANPDTIGLRFCNLSGGNSNPASATYRATVLHP
jgi:hypothetical protein